MIILIIEIQKVYILVYIVCVLACFISQNWNVKLGTDMGAGRVGSIIIPIYVWSMSMWKYFVMWVWVLTHDDMNLKICSRKIVN